MPLGKNLSIIRDIGWLLRKISIRYKISLYGVNYIYFNCTGF